MMQLAISRHCWPRANDIEVSLLQDDMPGRCLVLFRALIPERFEFTMVRSSRECSDSCASRLSLVMISRWRYHH